MKIYSTLLYTLLITNVILKFFTNHLGIIPRHFNISDVMITGVLLLSFLVYRLNNYEKLNKGKMFFYLLIFNLICIIGSFLNAKYIYLPAAISQLIMWNEPIILFLILINVHFSIQSIDTFKKLLFFLIIIELIIGIFQIPTYISTGESESIIGTFQHNAEQYAAFLMIGVFYLLGRMTIESSKKRVHIIWIVGILILILLTENKASWIAMGVSLFFLLNLIGKIRRDQSSRIKIVFLMILFSLIGYLVISLTSSTSKKYENIFEAVKTNNILELGKMKAYADIFRSHSNHIWMFLVGSGLGTFYSRASTQYFGTIDDYYGIPDEYYSDHYNVSPKKNYRESDSMGGVIKQAENFEPYFKQFYIDRKIFLVYSGTADSPYSSYVSLLGETGIIGFLIYIGFYIYILKRLKYYLIKHFGNPNIFPLIAASFGFLIYLIIMSFYNFWLETGRLTTILWSMIAMVVKYNEMNEMKAPVDIQKRTIL